MNPAEDWASPEIPRRNEPLGVSIANTWARVYTAGAPADLREGRRDEIASDTWEQRAAAGETTRTSAAIAWRTFRGMPADVSWRFEQASPARALAGAAAARGRTSLRWTVNRGLPGVTLLLAGGYAAVGLLLFIVLGAGGGDRPPGEMAWIASLMLVSGALIAAAFALIPRRRKTGLAMLVAGLLPFSLALAVTVVVPVASVLALVCGWLRSKRRA